MMSDLAYKYDNENLYDSKIASETAQSENQTNNVIYGRDFTQYFEEDKSTLKKNNRNDANYTLFEDNNYSIKNTPVFTTPKLYRNSYFQALQKWEGMVLEVHNDYFSARVNDQTKDNLEEYVEFDLEEIDDEDMKLVKPGSIFYWSIGYFTTDFGQRHRISEIRFRRLPAWTKRHIDSANMKADILMEKFGSES